MAHPTSPSPTSPSASTTEPTEPEGLPLSNGRDAGEISIAVGNRDNQVIIQFGRAVAWVGMSRSDATRLAEILLQHAQQTDGTY